jgi:hypothetical protein
MRRPAATWLAPLGVAVLVLVILGVVALVTTRDDEPSPASTDPTLASSSATSSAGTPSASSSAPVVPSVDFIKPAKAAAKDGFPALVPADAPPGWVVTDAMYTPGKSGAGPLWKISFQLPEGGSVVLTQSELALPKAVQRYLGAGAVDAGKVDLRKFGTGYWRAFTVDGGAGIAKQLANTSVVVSAPDQDGAVTLAKQLLTYEDYDSPEAG